MPVDDQVTEFQPPAPAKKSAATPTIRRLTSKDRQDTMNFGRKGDSDSDDEHAQAQELSRIKARTMYKMVEPVGGASGGGDMRKVLFLSGIQAGLVATRPDSLQKMLDVGFEIQKPRQLLMQRLAIVQPCVASSQ